jgi:cation diffusion facilitator CzcD-associated flavoprotein CzcO
MPSKKFADGFEIRDYFKVIVDKFGLGEKPLFHTLTTGLRWDNEIQRWHVTTDRGDDLRARFVIMANGLLNIPKLPGISGIRDFKGKMFHTSRWQYDYTGGESRKPALEKMADKTVAIIGTGATAIQAVPYLGKYSKQLYVLQRTPSTVDQRVNPATDQAWAKGLAPGWQKERKANFHRAAMERFKPDEPDMICDIWTEINRNMSAEFKAEGWPDVTLKEFMRRRELVDYAVMERLRARVEELVEDKQTAEILKPWYRFLCKRPASNNEFYPTFNRPNVKLIDVSGSRGIDRMTEKGFVANGQEYEIDCMIFASGFEVSGDLDRRWGIEVIEGRDGLSLYDHWRDGYSSLHGIMTRKFPNMFFTGYVQSGLNASTTEQMNQHDFHIAQIIAEAQKRKLTVIEPTQESEDAWVHQIRTTAADASMFIDECTPSYFNGESSKKPRLYSGEPYGPGWDAYLAKLQEWRDAGMPGLDLESADA